MSRIVNLRSFLESDLYRKQCLRWQKCVLLLTNASLGLKTQWNLHKVRKDWKGIKTLGKDWCCVTEKRETGSKETKSHVTSGSFSPPYWISGIKVRSTWPLPICIFLQIARLPLCSLRLILWLKTSRIRWSYRKVDSSYLLFFLGFRMKNKTRC